MELHRPSRPLGLHQTAIHVEVKLGGFKENQANLRSGGETKGLSPVLVIQVISVVVLALELSTQAPVV